MNGVVVNLNEKKILILGANGMAGHMIAIYLIEKGYSVDTITRSRYKIGRNYISDYNDNFNDIKKIFRQEQYDIIINCIGVLNKNADKFKYDAVKFNSLLPHFLVDLTKNSKTKVIHLSTDCVFSGSKGFYKENDFKDGPTFYDQTKAIGEINDRENITFRNSIIGPDLSEEGIGLFNWFMKQENDIMGYSEAIWNGVTTLTLAKAIVQAIEDNLTGLYQLASEPISKYDLLKIINNECKVKKINIAKDSNFKINKTLVNTRSDFKFKIPTHIEMIREMKKWILDHKELYPHYLIKGDLENEKA